MSMPLSIYTTRSGTDANAPAIDGVTVSGANTFYSDMWTGLHSDGYGMTIFFTGTPTGTFTLWNTDKPRPDVTNDNDWVQDTTFTPTNPAGAGGKFATPNAGARGFRHRLKYVNSAGTGVITGYVTPMQHQ